MTRSHEPELLDLGPSYYTQSEYDDCLHQLSRIGTFLGGNKATLHTLKQQPAFESILDFGCGGGQFAIELGKLYPQAEVVGMDISSSAIDFANRQLKKTSLQNVSFHHGSFPLHPVDIITTTLVCHHLNDEELIAFLKNSYQKAKKGIIINDLHRHWLAYSSFALLSKLFFRNRLIYHDGLLSIKKSFKKKDWKHCLTAANIPLEQCRIRWHFAFRWVLHIDKST